MPDSVRIVMCGNVQIEDGDTEFVLISCARDAGFEHIDIESIESPIDIIEGVLRPQSAELFDLIVCGIEMQGMTALHVMRDISEAEFIPPTIAFSDDASVAYEALQLGISELLLAPVSLQSFTVAAQRQLSAIAAKSGASLVVRDGGIMRKIALANIIRIETAGHDQVIYLAEGENAKIRKTSSDMFDMVAHDDRFFKVGSSSIINLDRVKSVRESNKSIHMEDGSVITAPVRIRKTLEDTLLSRTL